MNTTESVESVQGIDASAITDGPVPYPNDVAAHIWQVVTSMMEPARKTRGMDPEVDFQDYLDFLETITAADLSWFLTSDDEELQTQIVNEWVDDMEATRLSDKPSDTETTVELDAELVA